ncbi:MAG: hypothetical protein IJI57_03495, partial [Flexilinea sp.]|nr:hypothetical protein [Flexilinea sp.]
SDSFVLTGVQARCTVPSPLYSVTAETVPFAPSPASMGNAASNSDSCPGSFPCGAPGNRPAVTTAVPL